MDDATALARNQRLSDTRSHQVFARATAIAEHHHDTENSDKPLWLMVPAGAIAFIALVGAGWTGYQFWVVTPHIAQEVAVPKLVVSLVIYFLSLFGFSYGYELYDVGKAVKLTLIIGVLGLAAAVIVVALAAVLGGKGSSKSGSSSNSNSSSSPTSGTGGSGFSLNLGGGPYHHYHSYSSYGGGSTGSSSGSGFTLGSLGSSTPPACCQFCARPLPPGGALAVPDGADPFLFCPKCGQQFEAAGENARSAGTS